VSRTLEITRPEAPPRGLQYGLRGNGHPPQRPATLPRARRQWRLAIVVGVLLAAAATVFLALRGSESQPPDRAAEFVGDGAYGYVHVSSDRSGEQWRRAADLMDKLPLLQGARDRFLTRPLDGIDLTRDVMPWLGGEAAFALTPLADGRPEPLLVLQARDERLAQRTLSRLAGAGTGTPYRGTRLVPLAGDNAAALTDGFVLAGAADAVKRAIDVRRGENPSLAEIADYTKLRDDLPKDRLLHGYVSRTLLQSDLAGPAAVLAGAAGAERIEAGAFSFGLDAERGRFAFRGSAPRGCEGSGDSDSVLSKGPAQPLAVLGLGNLQCLVGAVLSTPQQSGAGRWLRGFLEDVQKRDKIDLRRELLPLLKGQTAVTLSEDGQAPLVSAAVGGVNEQKALSVLGKLQPALLRLVDPEKVGSAAGFSARQVAGVGSLSASITPDLQLSYAAFEHTLVASTSPRGIQEAKNGKGPKSSDDFRALLGGRPDQPSAVVFFDLSKLLALGDRVGLADVPAYLAIRDDLQKLRAVGAWVSREEEAIKAELLFRTP
jgi:Protein of unknown function (DUF3352)